MKKLLLLIEAFGLLFLSLQCTPAFGQEEATDQMRGHERYHGVYSTWKNGLGGDCCSNRDCHPFEGQYEYTKDPELPVRAQIEGQWCPIIKKRIIWGKSPDGGPHLCISPPSTDDDGPCSRVLCFTPGNDT